MVSEVVISLPVLRKTLASLLILTIACVSAQFWDDEPVDFPTYWAPRRECQNAALFQMMQTAVEQATAASRPLLVNTKPTTWDDAVANLAAFSDEARLKQPSPADFEAAVTSRLRFSYAPGSLPNIDHATQSPVLRRELTKMWQTGWKSSVN